MFAQSLPRQSRPLFGLGICVLFAAACGGGAEPEPASEPTEVVTTEITAPTEPAAAEPREKVPEDIDAILGDPLVVGGETVSREQIKRCVVVGATGRSVLESAKLQVFIDEEVQRRIDEGQDATEFEITDAAVADAIQTADKMVEEEYAGNDEVNKATDLFYMPQGMYMDQVRQTQLFDKVFLPEDPNDYPPTTVAALNSQAEDFVQRLIEGHELRMQMREEKAEEVDTKRAELETAKAEAGEDAEKLAAVEAMTTALAVAEKELADLHNDQGQLLFRQLMRQLVISALNRSADVKTHADGLPSDVAMEVNGRQIMTDDIWRAIRYKVTEEDVHDAKLWFAKTLVIRQGLEASGHYMTDEEFEQSYFEHTDPYKDSPFSIPAVAVSFKKFPSEDAYKEHYRLAESYKKMIESEITDESLAAHNETRTKNLLGLAKVDVEIILISAYDFKKSAFQPNGWEEAKKRAVNVMQRLADGDPWNQVLEECSEFYEPPLGKSSQNMAQQFAKNKGRFGQLNRNELLQKIGESDFSLFLTGQSLTDTIFFDLEIGVPSQPLKGPHGYYVCLVKGRTSPATQISLEGTHRNLVEQDYLAVRMNEYARQRLDEANVQGL